MTEELNKEERKLLEDLISYRKNLREGWKKSLQKGLEIPDEGLKEKLSGKNYSGAVSSLQNKGLIEVEEKEVVVDRADWSIDYDKEGSSLEKEKNIRGSEQKKYLKVPEEKLEEIINVLDID